MSGVDCAIREDSSEVLVRSIQVIVVPLAGCAAAVCSSFHGYLALLSIGIFNFFPSFVQVALFTRFFCMDLQNAGDGKTRRVVCGGMGVSFKLPELPASGKGHVCSERKVGDPMGNNAGDQVFLSDK